MLGFTPAQEKQIREYIRNQQLIYAIKLYREVTGVGLAEAKAAVEAIARGEAVNVPTSTPQVPVNGSLAESQIKELLAKRNKIEAIKVYRTVYRVGLKEAKDAVDQIEASMRGNGNFTSTPSATSSYEPVMSNNPFDDDDTSGRVRLIITVAVLMFILGGAVVFFLMR